MKKVIIFLLIILAILMFPFSVKASWGRLQLNDESLQVEEKVKVYVVYDQLEKVNCYVVVGHQATSEIFLTGRNVAINCLKIK